MLRCVFFDLVGTLVRGTRPIGKQYADHVARFLPRPESSVMEAAFRQAMASAPPMTFQGASFGDAAMLEREWWRRLVEDVLDRAGVAAALRGGRFADFFDGLYDHFTTAAAWELYPDVLPTLERIRAEGARLGLITNYDTRVFAVVEAVGLAPLLSAVVVPAHVGAAKPDRAIFAHALERLGARPEEALHVGDELDDDYRGAEQAGIGAVLIDRRGTYRRQAGIRRIESLSELVSLA